MLSSPKVDYSSTGLSEPGSDFLYCFLFPHAEALVGFVTILTLRQSEGNIRVGARSWAGSAGTMHFRLTATSDLPVSSIRNPAIAATRRSLHIGVLIDMKGRNY